MSHHPNAGFQYTGRAERFWDSEEGQGGSHM